MEQVGPPDDNDKPQSSVRACGCGWPCQRQAAAPASDLLSTSRADGHPPSGPSRTRPTAGTRDEDATRIKSHSHHNRQHSASVRRHTPTQQKAQHTRTSKQTRWWRAQAQARRHNTQQEGRAHMLMRAHNTNNSRHTTSQNKK
eukprot:scaffold2735_cov114-Isochrysis_galbana.AAC.1